MLQQLFCITRAYIKAKLVPGMTKCPGAKLIFSTHCLFCDLYDGSQDELVDDEVENPVILETEEATW